ncbi:MAG: hypothetical protein HY741_25260 [Chloroflexi bacterium]|nr:hypothetical protein [Chloroflexota bacterium]
MPVIIVPLPNPVTAAPPQKSACRPQRDHTAALEKNVEQNQLDSSANRSKIQSRTNKEGSMPRALPSEEWNSSAKEGTNETKE